MGELESDAEMHHRYLRMHQKIFEKLLSMIEAHRKKYDTSMRENIPVVFRLALSGKFTECAHL